MSSTKWYYQDPATEGRAGPVGVQFVRNLLLTQSIEEDTLVWTKGMTNWEPIQNVPIFMTPLERDLKEYYTPGKDDKTHKERDIALMKEFDEGWYFQDEEGSTHGPIHKTEIVEIIKAAADWDTKVWNVNILIESGQDGGRLRFRDVFPEEVGKDSSIYKGVDSDQLAQEVQKLEERVHPQAQHVTASLDIAEDYDTEGIRFDDYPSDNDRQESNTHFSQEGTSHDASDDPTLSLDSMLLIQKEMQKNKAKEKDRSSHSKGPTATTTTAAAEEPWSSSSPTSTSKVTGSLKNLLQDAEALLESVTPKPKAQQAPREKPQEKEQEEDEWHLEDVTAEVKPAFSDADLESYDFGPGFLTQYISVQRQAFEFRKNLFSKGK